MAATTTDSVLPVRLVILSPPAGVALAVQMGRTELLPPTRGDERALFFEFALQLAHRRGASADAAPVLRGPAVQGRLDETFIYLNWGKRAGDLASPWDRRAKIMLAGITPALLEKWRVASAADAPCVLAARFAGRGRDGKPVCARVPLLDGGWRVETRRGAVVP